MRYMVKATTKRSKSPKRVTKAAKPSDDMMMDTTESSNMSSTPSERSNKRFLPIIAIAIVALVGVAIYQYKQVFVAAMINNQPILRSTLNNKLQTRYGDQTLDSLIGETLIVQEARKKNINVSEKEVSDRIDQMKKTLPEGMSFEQALEMQGMNESDFRQQLYTSILVDKLLSGQASVSAAEIATYIEQNKETMTATDEAALQAEAQESLKQQKTQEIFQTWYENLRKNANIQKFL